MLRPAAGKLSREHAWQIVMVQRFSMVLTNQYFRRICDNLDELKESLENGLSGIYLLHRDDPDRPVEEIMDSLPANQYAACHGLRQIQVIHTWWSMASYTGSMWNDPTTTHIDQETAAYCGAKDCIVMAYTSQAKGFFQKACAQGVDQLDPMLKHRILTKENLIRLEKLQTYCAEVGSTPTDVVLGYITSHPLRGVALVSCSNMKQLEDVLNSSNYVLPEEMIQQFDGYSSV